MSVSPSKPGFPAAAALLVLGMWGASIAKAMGRIADDGGGEAWRFLQAFAATAATLSLLGGAALLFFPAAMRKLLASPKQPQSAELGNLRPAAAPSAEPEPSGLFWPIVFALVSLALCAFIEHGITMPGFRRVGFVIALIPGIMGFFAVGDRSENRDAAVRAGFGCIGVIVALLILGLCDFQMWKMQQFMNESMRVR